MRRLIALAALGTICGCGEGAKQGDDEVNEMIGWMGRNPPVSDATWSGVQLLECRPTRVDICKPEGCSEGKPVAWQKWEPRTSIYSRCTEDGCDDYTAQVSYSGSWANIVVPESAFMARITASGEYYEIATQMDGVLIYRGQCQRQ